MYFNVRVVIDDWPFTSTRGLCQTEAPLVYSIILSPVYMLWFVINNKIAWYFCFTVYTCNNHIMPKSHATRNKIEQCSISKMLHATWKLPHATPKTPVYTVRLVIYITESYITRIERVGEPYREVCLCTELWPETVHQPNCWSKRPGTWIEHVLAYCRDGKKYVGCIELLL